MQGTSYWRGIIRRNRSPVKRCPMKTNDRKKGMVFIVALWIVLVLAGLIIVLARGARVELLISANRLASLQAEWIAKGALAFAIYQIDNMEEDEIVPGEFYDCEAVPMAGGYIWFLLPDYDDDLNYNFGIGDESGKLNLNTAPVEMLLMLPGMTDELAASIVDWRSSEEESTAGGAKSEYYLLLSPAYQCKSGPLETVEEVLLVKGASMEVLFGEDTNRNGVLDENENDGAKSLPEDNIDGVLNRGIYDFVTVYSNQTNVSRVQEQGTLVNVNSSNTTGLTELLRDVLDANRLSTVMGMVRRGRPFENILDFYARTGLSLAEFEKIAPQLTVGNRGRKEGLVNVNTAPREVLTCLPGLEEADVYALIDYRSMVEHTALKSIAWVAEVLPPEKAAEVGNWITTYSYQFSADILAVSGDGRAFKRFRAIIDRRSSPPQVTSWQDLTGLGWPLAPEILNNLRKGITPYQTLMP